MAQGAYVLTSRWILRMTALQQSGGEFNSPFSVQNLTYKTTACSSAYSSLFQALGQFGQSKKQLGDECGLVEQDPTCFPLFLYQTTLVAQPLFGLSPLNKSLEQAISTPKSVEIVSNFTF